MMGGRVYIETGAGGFGAILAHRKAVRPCDVAIPTTAVYLLLEEQRCSFGRMSDCLPYIYIYII